MTIEGTIGVGKTSLIQKFSEEDCLKLPEDISSWTNFRKHDLLADMYLNPKGGNTFRLELHVLFSKTLAHLEDTSKTIKIQERSVWSARKIFMSSSFSRGNLDSVELGILDNYFNYMEKQILEHHRPDLVVYMRCSPRTSLDRIRLRHRAGEECISLDDAQDLHKRHDDWLLDPTEEPLISCPILVKNISSSHKQSTADYAGIIKLVNQMAAEPYLG